MLKFYLTFIHIFFIILPKYYTRKYLMGVTDFVIATNTTNKFIIWLHCKKNYSVQLSKTR